MNFCQGPKGSLNCDLFKGYKLLKVERICRGRPSQSGHKHPGAPFFHVLEEEELFIRVGFEGRRNGIGETLRFDRKKAY